MNGQSAEMCVSNDTRKLIHVEQ